MIIINNSNRGVLEDLKDYVKIIKSDIFVLLENGVLIGTNETISTMRIVQTDIYGYRLIHDSNSIKELPLDLQDGSIINDEFIGIELLIDVNQIIDTYYRLMNIKEHKTYITINNINEDERFRLLYEIKAADGLRFIRLNDLSKPITIPIFTGCIPIVKSDKVDLNIYYFDNNYYLMYDIYKKKIKTNVLAIYNCLML